MRNRFARLAATLTSLYVGVGAIGCGSTNDGGGPGVGGSDAQPIAFVGGSETANDVFIIQPDGTGQQNLTNDADVQFNPTWSPDHSKLAFANQTGLAPFEIHTIRADGTSRTRLTDNAANDTEPAWSPDGQKIAFTSDRDGNSEVYVMSALDGSGQTRLTNNVATDGSPAWSPDGTQIAFVSSRGGGSRVYVMNADGSNVHAVTAGSLDGQPDWSPNGQRLVFASYSETTHEQNLYSVKTDGTGLLPLTRGGGFSDPAWSPSGNKIIFLTGGDAGKLAVWTMNSDGTGIARVTHNAVEEWTPSWK